MRLETKTMEDFFREVKERKIKHIYKNERFELGKFHGDDSFTSLMLSAETGSIGIIWRSSAFWAGWFQHSQAELKEEHKRLMDKFNSLLAKTKLKVYEGVISC